MQITERIFSTKVKGVITIEDIIKAFNLPPTAKVNFNVPGGGDYSNTSLSIEEYPLTVEWTE